MRVALAALVGVEVATLVTAQAIGLGPAIALNFLTMATVLYQLTRLKTHQINEEIVEDRVAKRTEKLEKLMTHYEQQAMTDALTGLLNRRGGEESIQHHVARSLRVGTAISFILMDIDHFKKVNDRYGHATGDLVISGITNALKQQLRTSDIGIRWGGEEFLICLPDTDLSGAITAAQKLRQVIEDLDFDITPITVSMGCAELGQDPFHVALARADMALYFAKSKGRNQVFPNSLEK